MKRFAIVAVILAITSGLLLNGTFGHWLIAMASGIYLGVPLAFLLGIWLVIGLKRDGQIPNGLRKTFLTSVIVGGSLLLSLGTGASIHYWKIREARNFVMAIVPKLDQYRKDHGHYPSTLDPLGVTSLPKLFRDTYYYTADTESFRFKYWDSARLMDGYYFDSTSRKWNHFD